MSDLPEGFIPHDGGPCPVPLDSRPAVLFRDGFAQGPAGYAPKASDWVFTDKRQDLWTWQRTGPADIIAYRPEEPQP